MLQIDHKSKKWQWSHNFPTYHHLRIFWRYFVSLVNFSYLYKFHVNIISGSGIMTILFYKGLTRNPEIGNTSLWILPNSWRLGQVRDKKFSMNVSNKILLNAAKCQGYSFYCFWVIKGIPTGGGVKLPTDIRVKNAICYRGKKLNLFFICLFFRLQKKFMVFVMNSRNSFKILQN